MYSITGLIEPHHLNFSSLADQFQMQTVHTFRFVDALLPVFRQPKDSTHFCSFKNQWTDCCLNCAFHHSEDEARINVCLKIFTSHRNMETNGVSKTQQRIEEELSVHGLYKMGWDMQNYRQDSQKHWIKSKLGNVQKFEMSLCFEQLRFLHFTPKHARETIFYF